MDHGAGGLQRGQDGGGGDRLELLGEARRVVSLRGLDERRALGRLGQQSVELTEHRLECYCHGAVFDVRTGEALVGPAVSSLETYPVREQDGEIQVEV